MKLLLDQNLSWRLVADLQELFPGSVHVRTVGLDQASDVEVWEFAKSGDFTIVSKDSDFEHRSWLFGHPPKCIWLRVGNCSTESLKSLVLKNADQIQEFGRDSDESYLLLP